MKKFATLFLGSALTALVAGTALAAATVPATVAAAPAATVASEPATVTTNQSVKIGYIDMSKIASETDKGKAVTVALKARSGKLRTKIEARQKQIEKQKTAIEAKIASLTPKQREAKAKEFQKKMEDYQKLVRASDLEMQELQEKLTTDLFNAVKKAASDYGKSHGYAAVVSKKDFLYQADTPEPKDLTEEISAILDQKQKSK